MPQQGAERFVVLYRNPAGQTRRKVIGRFGLMTVEEARRTARVMLGEVAKGADPVEETKQVRGHTVSEICDW